MAEFIAQDCCSDAQDKTSLSVLQARQRILEQVTPLDSWQKVALRDALNQVLHQAIVSPFPVPPHDNSAMDGYAMMSTDLQSETFTLKQVGTAMAGQPYTGEIRPGECIRIMTGAMMPAACDTVIMQEQVKQDGDQIIVHGTHHAGQHVRHAGEDIQTGDTVLPAGHRLMPADLGLIASLGMTEVCVKRKPRIAFFSTGDELRSLGETLEQGQIYDSNRYTLYGMLKRLDVDMVDMGVIKDDKPALREALILASTQADAIITSGGVSVGDADYVKTLLAELGHVNFWKIAMKPGRPLAFGTLNETLFFGLPGNPVSVMVTFYQFVAPALRKLAGDTQWQPLTLPVTCASPIRKRPGRFEFQRGILFTDESNGQYRVKTTGEQGSGILRSMSQANCFILLPENCDGIAENDTVMVQPFSGLI